jgi:hypothetical protein
LNVTFLKRPLKNLLKFIRNKRRKHSDIYRFNEVCWLLDLPNPFYKFGMLQTQTQRAICNGYNKALHIIMKRDQLDMFDFQSGLDTSRQLLRQWWIGCGHRFFFSEERVEKYEWCTFFTFFKNKN